MALAEHPSVCTYDCPDTCSLTVDVENGRIIADLEEFSVSKNGHLFRNKDFNFWGVTFTPDARYFYATLSTGQQHFLILPSQNLEQPQVLRKHLIYPYSD